MSWFLLPRSATTGLDVMTSIAARPARPQRASADTIHAAIGAAAKHMRHDHTARTGADAPHLGTAHAAASWQWVAPRAIAPRTTPQRTPQGPLVGATALRVPASLLQRMAYMSDATGRNEAELWAEAAEEWLSRRDADDEPQPPTPASAMLALPHTTRTWDAIDAVLAELRSASHAPAA